MRVYELYSLYTISYTNFIAFHKYVMISFYYNVENTNIKYMLFQCYLYELIVLIIMNIVQLVSYKL